MTVGNFKSKKDSFARWSSFVSQGKGVHSFRGNKVGNSWLYSGELFPGEFIDLVRIRSNTFPTVEYLARQEPRESISCRRCHARDETLGHVLGDCPAGRPVRLVRHDRIVNKIEEVALGNGLIVAKEQIFVPDVAPDGRQLDPLRPDLVVITPSTALIVDVTVRYEQVNSLAEAAREKITKYNPLLTVIKSKFKVNSAKVLPLVFGARGGFPSATAKGLADLGISDALVVKDLVMDILRSTVAIARGHADLG